MPKRSRPDHMTREEFREHNRKLRRAGSVSAFEIEHPPSEHLSAEELIAHRKQKFSKKHDHEAGRKLIPVRVASTEPIGILHFGDPHLDDDGTDLAALELHMELVLKTPGLFCANIGDTRNNWVGRLARLYGQQSTSAAEALILAEWFVKKMTNKWLYMIAGNHCVWSGADDPLVWFAAQAGCLYEDMEARMEITFPNGKVITINAKHNHPGNSQWNPAHSVMKEAQLGLRDDVIISGHMHVSGYSPLKDPDTGKICHCIKTGTYKTFDRYAREKAFRDQSFSPCVVTILDPLSTSPLGLVDVDFDPFRAARKLTALRGFRGVD